MRSCGSVAGGRSSTLFDLDDLDIKGKIGIIFIIFIVVTCAAVELDE